jgi:hypothetical protein
LNIGENLTQCFHRPIVTYGGRGTLKAGVHFEDHAIVYTSHDLPPLLEAEQISEKFASIRITPQSSRDKLDPTSRVNYTKLYTIEYNVKIQVVGQVDENYMGRFLNSVRLAHPSLSSTAKVEAQSEFLGDLLKRILIRSSIFGSSRMGYQVDVTATFDSPQQYLHVAWENIITIVNHSTGFH